MNRSNQTQQWKAVALATLLLLANTLANAQTTAFTYQGKLTDAGNPASGTYDMQFKLFDVLGGGSQQGATLTLPVPVSAGIFTPGTQMIGGTAYLQPATGGCTGIPAAAKAVVGNATTVNVSANGFLIFWPSDSNPPTVAISNYRSGIVFNWHFTVGLGADGAFKRFASTTTDLVIDLSGYLAP